MDATVLDKLKIFLEAADLIERAQTRGLITPEQRKAADQLLKDKTQAEISKVIAAAG